MTDPFASPPPRSPFSTPTRRPEHLADAEGRIRAADEVVYLVLLAMGEWIDRHELDVTVKQLEARVLEVGQEVACAEALSYKLPTR